MIRVLLAEDQGMMRGALALLLNLEPDIEVVAEVSSGTEVVPAALAHRPDVALLDIEMPGRSGLDNAASLRTALPSCRRERIRRAVGITSPGPSPPPSSSTHSTSQFTQWQWVTLRDEAHGFPC